MDEPLQTPSSKSTEVHGVPTPGSWPGAFGAYKFAKAAVIQNWEVLLGLFLANILLGTILELSMGRVGNVLADFANVAFSFAVTTTYLSGVRSKKISFTDSFKKITLESYTWYLLGLLLVVVLTIGSFILFLVPFIFVYPRIILTQYFLVDKQLGPVEALKASWKATEGHLGIIWGTIGAMFAMALLALTIIGIPFAIYFVFMYSGISVVLYEYLCHRSHTKAAPPHIVHTKA